MFDRRGRWVAGAVAALGIGAATPLPAQRPDPDSALRARVAALGARRDTLARRWREAKRIADATRGSDRDPIPAELDTVRVGPLLILTNPSPLPVRRAAPVAQAILDSLFGSALEGADRRPYYLEALDPDTGASRPARPWGNTFTWDLDSAELVTSLVTTIPLPTPDPGLLNWLGGAGVQPTFHRRSELEDAYRHLITAPYAVARECYHGSIEGCRSALSLDPAATRIARAYRSPEERRRAAGGFAGYFDDAIHRPMFAACAEGGDSMCVALLRFVDPSSLPKVLGDRDRQLLVRLALVTGGRDAYRRLVANTAAPIADRLAAAAGVPVDSLVARWQREVLAARPVPVSFSAAEAATGILWIVLFGLAGSRSSRWRSA